MVESSNHRQSRETERQRRAKTRADLYPQAVWGRGERYSETEMGDVGLESGGLNVRRVRT